jgi:superfamily II DNA or RNA helicase
VLIHKKSNSVVLHLRDPEKIRAVIPKSKTVVHKGQSLVQVHYGLDEVKVLNNMGISVPSPIHHNYEWMGKYTPMKHQASTSAFFTLNPRSICLNGMGTGKTISVLWAADYLMKLGKLKRVLIVCPMSTMHSVWQNEINTHFLFKRQCVVLHGTKERRLNLLGDPDAEFFIINHDGIKTIHKELMERDFDCIVVDEAAAFRNASTQRYKLLE